MIKSERNLTRRFESHLDTFVVRTVLGHFSESTTLVLEILKKKPNNT